MTEGEHAIGGATDRPKHERVRDVLVRLVEELEPRAPLPSERVLAERFRVARMTVRQAIDALVHSGAVFRVPGAGTFKSAASAGQPLSHASFADDMRARGLRPGATTVAQRVEPAPPCVARHLGVDVAAPALRLERLRTADGEPMALERRWLDVRRVPGLADRAFADGCLYATLRDRYAVRPAAVTQTVGATTCDEDEADLLEVAPGAPALLFERLTVDERHEVVDYARSVYRGDRYRLRMTLPVSRPSGEAALLT